MQRIVSPPELSYRLQANASSFPLNSLSTMPQIIRLALFSHQTKQKRNEMAVGTSWTNIRKNNEDTPKEKRLTGFQPPILKSDFKIHIMVRMFKNKYNKHPRIIDFHINQQ